MQNKIVGIAVVVTLIACASKTDPSEANFKAALDQYFAKKGDVCLDFPGWPKEINTSVKSFGSDRPYSDIAQMKALESVGLVESKEVEKPVESWGKPTGRTNTITQFDLTPAGKAAMRKPGTNTSAWSSGKHDLCYGKQAVDKIVKWDAPMSFGEYKATSVTYTYKINDLSPWASNPKMQEAFPQLKRTLEGVGSEESKHGVELTNLGWEANGLD